METRPDISSSELNLSLIVIETMTREYRDLKNSLPEMRHDIKVLRTEYKLLLNDDSKKDRRIAISRKGRKLKEKIRTTESRIKSLSASIDYDLKIYQCKSRFFYQNAGGTPLPENSPIRDEKTYTDEAYQVAILKLTGERNYQINKKTKRDYERV